MVPIDFDCLEDSRQWIQQLAQDVVLTLREFGCYPDADSYTVFKIVVGQPVAIVCILQVPQCAEPLMRFEIECNSEYLSFLFALDTILDDLLRLEK